MYEIDYEWTEEDLMDAINLVFCACDDSQNGSLDVQEFTGPVCEVCNFSNQTLFQNEIHVHFAVDHWQSPF